MVKKLLKNSNKARLDALSKRQSEQQKQAELIKHGLANATNSKKITFDSDSSDTETAPKLFKAENDSDSSDEDFFSKESKPKNVDARFVMEEETEVTEKDMASEVNHTLSLLADITGDTVIYSNEQKDNRFLDPSQKRFDPSKISKIDDNAQFTEAPTPIKKRKVEKIEDTKRFINITGNLTSAFGAEKEQAKTSGFCFDFSKATNTVHEVAKSRFGNLADDDMSISSSSDSETSESEDEKSVENLDDKHKLQLNLPSEKPNVNKNDVEVIDGIEYPKMPDWPLVYPLPPSKFDSKEEKKQHLNNLVKKRLNNFKKSQAIT